ncbi:MAG: hypothetical protein ACI4WS_09545 [Oscillospiraceae bacterium]
MKLYGKEQLVGLLEEVAGENRLPHAILLTGEKGSGRRTMAKFIAKQFMCGAVPCNNCNVCKKIDGNEHPDIIFVEQKCKDGKYNVDNVREYVCRDSAVKPNDGNVKIYVFEHSDELSIVIQNTILKNIEEPEEWNRFIFLCENAGNLLTTIRSRVTEYNLPECPPEQCCECLVNDYGVDRAQAKELSLTMSGNIGKCLDVLNGGDEVKLMDTARHIAAGIARKSGYMVCAALAEQSGRKEYAAVLEYLAGILRDALAVRAGGELCSCGKNEAKAVAKVFDEAAVTAMLDKVFEVNSAGALNLNLALCSAYLTSGLGL